MKKIRLKIKRQDSPHSASYWEEFEVENTPSMTLVGALEWIQKNPKNIKGEKTTPISWGGSCLEDLCGGCTVRVNGQVKMLCSTLMDSLKDIVVLEPLGKFPILRDLLVDQSSFISSQNRFLSWMEIDSLDFREESPLLSQKHWAENYPLALCTLCGACMETCPQVNSRSSFVGSATLSQALLQGNHPGGQVRDEERMEQVMAPGGIVDCSHVENCEAVCPKDIPLGAAMVRLARKATFTGIRNFFGW